LSFLNKIDIVFSILIATFIVFYFNLFFLKKNFFSSLLISFYFLQLSFLVQFLSFNFFLRILFLFLGSIILIFKLSPYFTNL
jgi:hypothetical protein